MKNQTKSKVFQVRIEENSLKTFQEVCSSMAINPSELVRQWITLFNRNYVPSLNTSVPGKLPSSYSLSKKNG